MAKWTSIGDTVAVHEQVFIDGNNLLHAMHAHAPLPNVGRETLVRIIERWASGIPDRVTLVFDGYKPKAGLAAQMASRYMMVEFSGSQTADDVIVAFIGQVRDPSGVRVITDDKAIRYEAGCRRCSSTGCAEFIRELFPPRTPQGKRHSAAAEKPTEPTTEQTDDWLEQFGLDTDHEEPFDDFGAMMPW